MPSATSDKILSFSGEYRFLSNFYIEPDGTHVELEFQREKCANQFDRGRFNPAMSPYAAKQLGKKVKLRSDWDLVKNGVMAGCVVKKFQDHPELAKLLLDTGDSELIEGNTWGDTYWGMCDGKGKNMLGKILMATRKLLRSEAKGDA